MVLWTRILIFRWMELVWTPIYIDEKVSSSNIVQHHQTMLACLIMRHLWINEEIRGDRDPTQLDNSVLLLQISFSLNPGFLLIVGWAKSMMHAAKKSCPWNWPGSWTGMKRRRCKKPCKECVTSESSDIHHTKQLPLSLLWHKIDCCMLTWFRGCQRS